MGMFQSYHLLIFRVGRSRILNRSYDLWHLLINFAFLPFKDKSTSCRCCIYIVESAL